MLRKISLLLILSAPLMIPTAQGATQEELQLQKAEMKYAQGVSKSVAKLAKKWNKNNDKGKDNAEIEKELKVYLRNELAWLREKGIKTVEDPEPMEHPAHPQKVLPEPPSETPKLEALRDICVELRTGELKPKGYSKKLDEYVTTLDGRAERKKNAYKTEKKAS